MDNEGAKVLSVLLVFTVHTQSSEPRLSEPRLSDTLIIRMQKFHKPHPHLENPSGSWRLQNLAKVVFSNCQSNAKRRKCIDYQREAGYMQAHAYRWILYGALWK